MSQTVLACADYYNDNGPDFFYVGSLHIGSASWKVQAINYSSYRDADDSQGAATAYAICTA